MTGDGEGASALWELGDFEIQQELGRGGMGVVYRALQKNLDRTVALKLFVGQSDPQDLARFEREAKAAARVDHPNIVRVFEAGRLHGQSYFAMEHVEGRDLQQMSARGPLPPREAARLMARVARAVQHLHEHDILHRDLKPSNILVDPQGQPKVTDFGIARLVGGESDTTTGTVFGSPSYMAPEQASADLGPMGPHTDVYGLGAVLYRLLTGQPPHRGEDAMETMLQAIRGAPRPPRLVNPAVPVQLEAICQRCLEKSPARRYASAAEVAGDLERFLAGEVVEAASRGPWTRLRRWVGRETGLAVHLLTLTAVLLAKLGAFAVTGARQDLLVTGGLALWLGCCGALHGLSRRRPGRGGVATAWGLMDVAFLTALLLLTNGISSPAMLGFPLIVIAAGLWLRLSPVLLTGAGALSGCLVLALDAALWHPERRLSVDGYVIVCTGVLAAVLLVLHQVRRARAVARFR